MHMKQRQSADAFGHLGRLVIGGHSIDIAPAFFQKLQTVKGSALDAEALGKDIKHAAGIFQPLLGAAGGGLKIGLHYFGRLNLFTGATTNLFQKSDIKPAGVV